MKKVFYCTLLLCLWTVASTMAQVIIGSDAAPHPSAGLDLSPFSAKKLGFLPPRIALSINPQDFILDTNSAADLESAVGMIVYNTAPEVQDGAGLYVWDGEKWNAVGKEPTVPPASTDCSFVMDVDGNVYQARLFPDDQCWMTSNLRTTRASNGDILSNVRMNPAYYKLNPAAAAIEWDKKKNAVVFHTETSASIYASFAVNDIAYNWDYNTYANQFGFHYTQEEAKKACPDGWKLPSEADYAALAVALSGDEIAGKKMKANNFTYISNMSSRTKNLEADQYYKVEWDGYAPGTPNNSGFGALPNGRVELSQVIGGIVDGKESSSAVGAKAIIPAAGNDFARYAYFWTDTETKAKRIGAKNQKKLDTITTAASSDLFGVRCIKIK